MTHYHIKVSKQPQGHNARKRSANYISHRGIFCIPDKAGHFTKPSAERWIRTYKERKEQGSMPVQT